MTGKKIGSPQGEQTHSDITEWGDCSLRCEATTGCRFWHYDTSTSSCSTMTGDGVYVDDANYVGGKRGCNTYANVTGWVTCSVLHPNIYLANNKKKDVILILYIGCYIIASFSRSLILPIFGGRTKGTALRPVDMKQITFMQ